MISSEHQTLPFFVPSVPPPPHHLPPPSSSLSPPRFGLQLFKQTSSSQERVSVNGIQKTIYVVVKNAPFTLHVGVNPSFQHQEKIDLNNYALDVSLVYDDVEQKEVDYVKSKPVEFKTTLSEHGDQATLELKIKVLTSQHENSFFRLKVFAINPRSGQPIPNLEFKSESIKVISKPESLKKKASSKKRNLNDLLVESITRIEHQQKEQQKMIEVLLEKSNSNSNSSQSNSSNKDDHPTTTTTTTTTTTSDGPCLTSSSNSLLLDILKGSACSGEEDKNESFENSFRKFFRSFNTLPSEDRPVKIRKLIKNCSQHDTEKISEFLDLFFVEGIQRGANALQQVGDGAGAGSNGGGSPVSSSSNGCHCLSCPYQQELQRIDDFYHDFLSTPVDNDNNSLFFQ